MRVQIKRHGIQIASGHARQLPTMQGVHESYAKYDALAKFLGEMVGVRPDVSALYERLGACADASDSKEEPCSLEEVDALEGREKKLLTEVKTKLGAI